MEFFVIILLSVGALRMSSAEEYNATDISNTTEYYDFTDDISEETENGRDFTPAQNQDPKNLRIYKGPLPKFPGSTISPWIALHSPVRMYIPIRNTGFDSPDSVDCIQCPRNLLVYLSPRQRYILTPIPTISICSSFARQSGRVHVAVVSGPRPGQRVFAGRYQVELMVWKAEGAVHSCNYSINVKEKRRIPTAARKISCLKPKQPANGIVLCDINDKKHYPHNSVCQMFCLRNYLIANSTSNSSTIVCRNGRWSPEDHVFCVATFCPDVPQAPSHGSWSCEDDDSKIGFKNGTTCKINCQSGYVIPSSQLEKSVTLCNPPSWNSSGTVPDCKRAHLPKIRNCHNRHIVVRKGQVVKVTPELLPKGTDHAGMELSTVCSLQRKNLPKGKHQNVCEVTDPELRTRHNCSYRIHVEESSGPHPHTGDCKNRTAFANRKGILHLKPVRFIIKIGEPARTRIIRSSCKPKGEIGIGIHSIVCKATDPDTKATGTCSYWFTVRERSCPPLKNILNGQISCSSRIIGAVCNYECDAGYTINSNHLPKETKSCQSNMRWHPELDPVCEIKPPQLLEGCDNLEVQLVPFEQFAVPLPRYLTALNETLNVSCSLPIINTIGHHGVSCSIDDERFNVSCNFNVTIVEKVELTTLLASTVNESEQPILVEGCEDLELNVSSPVNFTVPLPMYSNAQNRNLTGSCSPYILTTAGHHRVICDIDDRTFNISCNFNILIHEEFPFSNEYSEKSPCKPLPSPAHGSILCSNEGLVETCIVTCDPGYGFEADNSLSVVCDGGTDSLWDFQKYDINNNLPECFAQMEGSAVELWISFEAFAPHCEEEMEEVVRDLVNDLCQIGTDCSRVTLNCTLDEESDMMLMTVNWTVEADFNDEEYYEGEEIPEAEIRLESVLDRTRAFLAMEDAPGNIQLFRDSFRRGLITLVCPDGFVPNMLMAKCVQCLKEMEHC